MKPQYDWQKRFFERHPEGWLVPGLSFVTKDIDESRRIVTHLVSTPQEDRAGDVVVPTGAQLDNFRANPVVVVDHDYRVQSIIGKSLDIWAEDRGLWSRTQYSDGTELARDAWRLELGGFAPAWSIGFSPGQYEAIEPKDPAKGFRFNTWELLEYSKVAVPMNPGAVTSSIQLESVFYRGCYGVRPRDPEEPAKAAAQGPTADPEPRAPELSEDDAAAIRAANQRLDDQAYARYVDDYLTERGIK